MTRRNLVLAGSVGATVAAVGTFMLRAPRPSLVIRARVAVNGNLDFTSIRIQNVTQPFLVLHSGATQGFQADGTSSLVTWSASAGWITAYGPIALYQVPLIVAGEQRVTLTAQSGDAMAGKYYILLRP